MVPSILLDSFTMIGSHETHFVSFYRKSAGVLQDVPEFLQDVQNFLQDVPKRVFWRVYAGRKVKK